MKIPSFNIKNDFVQDNKLTKEAAAYLSKIVEQLQYFLGEDGYIQPSVTNDVVKRMEKQPTENEPNRRYAQPIMVHDSTSKEYRINDLKGRFNAVATKSTNKHYATEPWVNPNTGQLTQVAVNFLNTFVEGN